MMFKINKTTLALILITIFSNPGFSQKKEMELAHSEFIALQYNAAAESYQKAIRKIKEDTPEKQYSTYMLAECYRMMNNPDRAEPFYKELIKGNFSNTYPVIFLRYATVLKTNGNVGEAKEYFNKYLKEDPGNEEAKMGIKSCEWIPAKQKRAQLNVSDIKSKTGGEHLIWYFRIPFQILASLLSAVMNLSSLFRLTCKAVMGVKIFG